MKPDSELAIRMSLPDPSEGQLRNLTYAVVASVKHDMERRERANRHDYAEVKYIDNDMCANVHRILTEALKVPYACMDDSFKLLKDYINRQLPAPFVIQYPVCPRCIAADLNHNERNP